MFDEQINYPQGCSSASRIGLSASENDEAVKIQLIASMVGDSESYEQHCVKNPNPVFHCGKADKEGSITNNENGNGRFYYIDATELIRFNAPGTGGGAHSDIYRKETGRLIWELIQG